MKTLALCLLFVSMTAAEEVLPKWMPVPTEQSGLGATDARLKWPWITPPVDVDGDGDLDFCVYGHHGRKDEKKLGGTWYINDGKGRFTIDRNLDLIAAALEQFALDFADRDRIVNHQDPAARHPFTGHRAVGNPAQSPAGED